MTRLILSRQSQEDLSLALDLALRGGEGRAQKLLLALDEAFKKVEIQPRLYAIRDENVRRINLKGVPFSILFTLIESAETASIEDEVAVVIGIMHEAADVNRFIKRRDDDQ